MSSLLLHLRDPNELTVDISTFVESTESVSEVLDILRCIYTEQNEHNFQKFSEAYVKVSTTDHGKLVCLRIYFL